MNAKIIGFSSSKESKVTLQDALFSNEVISLMTGNDILTGVQTVEWTEVLTVEDGVTYNEVTLSKTPSVAGTLTNVYKMNADGSHGTELVKNATVTAGKYNITGKDITVDKTDCPVGTKLKVYYTTNTDATAKQMKLSADKYSSSFRLVLNVLVTDAQTRKNYAGQVNIFAAKMEDTFTMQFNEDGDPVPLDVPIEVLRDTSGQSQDMWTLTIFDEDLVV